MRARHVAWGSVGVVAAFFIWAGCGGSDTVTVDSSAGDGAVEGASADGANQSGGDGGGSKTDGGGNATDGGGDGGGGSAIDAGNGRDGGGPGPGGSTTSEPCGTQACAIPANVCCVSGGGGGGAMYTCATSCADAGIGNPGDYTALACTGAANCAPGSICCVKDNGNGVTSSCVVGTSCGPNSAQLCDPSAAVTGCPGDAGQRSMCLTDNISDWGLSKPFATCGGISN